MLALLYTYISFSICLVILLTCCISRPHSIGTTATSYQLISFPHMRQWADHSPTRPAYLYD